MNRGEIGLSLPTSSVVHCSPTDLCPRDAAGGEAGNGAVQPLGPPTVTFAPVCLALRWDLGISSHASQWRDFSTFF